MIDDPHLSRPREITTDDQAMFYRTIGRALAEWQNVEEAVCGVFEKVSTCQDGNVARAIFYSIQDFSNKLMATNAAAKQSLSKEIYDKTWKPLRKTVKRESEFRNALAHFKVVDSIVMGATEVESYVFMALIPNFLDPNEIDKERKKEFKEFTVNQLHTMRSKFISIRDLLNDFAKTIA